MNDVTALAPEDGARDAALLRETAGAALIFAALLVLPSLLHRNRPPPPATRTPRIAVDEAPWYILAAVEGVGPRNARRAASVAAALRDAGFRVAPEDLPGIGRRGLERLAADLPGSEPDQR